MASLADTAPGPTPLRRPATVTLANARLVLADRVQPGHVRIEAGTIAAVETGAAVPAGAIDCEGALLIPGLVELHTDNLERHLRPRPNVDWPRDAAVIAHDGELASAGITTVFDALRAGVLLSPFERHRELRYSADVAGRIARLAGAGVLRADHLLHVRAELCSHTLLEELAELAGSPRIRLVSVMDHAPGQRQYADEAKFRAYYRARYRLDDAELDRVVALAKALSAERGARHEAAVAAFAAAEGAALASHDDTTEAQVARSAALGVRLAEFPTTPEAARACRAAGQPVMMGAPNLLRGGSHAGNVSAAELAAEGLVDILSSDYVPSALLMGAMRLAQITGDLPTAVATVTRNPARAAGLPDRGEIAPGQRGDLVMLAEVGGAVVPAAVWAAGYRIG